MTYQIYHIDMIPRVVNLTESGLLQYFKDNDGDWSCFMGIVLDYFPRLVVCFWSDQEEVFTLIDFIECYIGHLVLSALD